MTAVLTPTTPGVRTSDLPARVAAFVVRWGFIAVTVGLILFFALTEPAFRAPDSILAMLKFAVPTAIAGLAYTVTMAAGGVDLSIGATAGFSVSIAAWTMVVGNQVGGVAVVVVVVGGALIGLLNALLIVVFRIPDLLATLAVMFVVQGLKLIIVDGKSISANMLLADGSRAPGVFTPDFLWIDRGQIGPIPVPLVLLIVLATAVWFGLEHTRWGRALAAVGGNPEAARLAGINVSRYRTAAYVISGALASVAGLVLAARVGQGDVTAGNSLLLDSIAVALVGVSVLGAARANAWGTVLGAVLLAVMLTGFTMAGQSYFVQDFLKGLVLVIALFFSFTLSRTPVRVSL
jgi:simple sugar transport system permease protein